MHGCHGVASFQGSPEKRAQERREATSGARLKPWTIGSYKGEHFNHLYWTKSFLTANLRLEISPTVLSTLCLVPRSPLTLPSIYTHKNTGKSHSTASVH